MERLYDVDFFVDRTEGGLVIADHYHKIDGAPLEMAAGISPGLYLSSSLFPP